MARMAPSSHCRRAFVAGKLIAFTSAAHRQPVGNWSHSFRNERLQFYKAAESVGGGIRHLPLQREKASCGKLEPFRQKWREWLQARTAGEYLSRKSQSPSPRPRTGTLQDIILDLFLNDKTLINFNYEVGILQRMGACPLGR